MTPLLRILGTRGIPAAHGGFETFAECLATFLVGRGWRVVVYCQRDGKGPYDEDVWNGVERVTIPVLGSGSVGSVMFDWHATRHAARQPGLCLTLGYNTAVFCALLRARGLRNLINMDGIEWRRQKWGALAKLWFWVNDWAGCWLGDHLIADNPEIKRHLETRVPPNKVSMIPYGAEKVTDAPPALLAGYGLHPGQFLSVVARPEPENSILQIVKGFSARPRGLQLAVVGDYHKSNAYHRAVKAAASSEVVFVGAIYDKAVLKSLRFHSFAYIHGHQAGGTNPSLVEAMGAGNAIFCHDNDFNRWVAGDQAGYFTDAASLDRILGVTLADRHRLATMRLASGARFEQDFRWNLVLMQYERLLTRFAGLGVVD